MGTMENLEAAFAGESQANRKYLAFADKAGKEGHPQIARLFRATAAAETIHAHTHLRVLGGIQDTAANLTAAIEGERHEFEVMYPEFIKAAEAEGNKQAVMAFKNASAAEAQHYELYRKALETLNAGQDLPQGKIFVCAVCGSTVEGDAPERCAICGAPRSRFAEIE